MSCLASSCLLYLACFILLALSYLALSCLAFVLCYALVLLYDEDPNILSISLGLLAKFVAPKASNSS